MAHCKKRFSVWDINAIGKTDKHSLLLQYHTYYQYYTHRIWIDYGGHTRQCRVSESKCPWMRQAAVYHNVDPALLAMYGMVWYGMVRYGMQHSKFDCNSVHTIQINSEIHTIPYHTIPYHTIPYNTMLLEYSDESDASINAIHIIIYCTNIIPRKHQSEMALQSIRWREQHE